MIAPSTILGTPPSDGTTLTIYGMADIIQKDSAGNIVFTQSIHNAVTNQGEDYILNQVFSTAPGNSTSNIASICITDNDDGNPDTTEPDLTIFSVVEGLTATIPLPNTYTDTLQKCQTDTQVTVTTPEITGLNSSGSSITTVGPLVFTASTTDTPGNLDADKEIKAILICQKNSTTTCNVTLFAVVDLADMRLSAGSSTQITYKLDLTSNVS